MHEFMDGSLLAKRKEAGEEAIDIALVRRIAEREGKLTWPMNLRASHAALLEHRRSALGTFEHQPRENITHHPRYLGHKSKLGGCCAQQLTKRNHIGIA